MKLLFYFYLFIVTKDRELQNKLNEMWKHTKHKYISQPHRQQKSVEIVSWSLTILIIGIKEDIRTIHMDLVADGRPCFPQTDKTQSPGVWDDLHRPLDLKRQYDVYKNYTQRKPGKLAV